MKTLFTSFIIFMSFTTSLRAQIPYIGRIERGEQSPTLDILEVIARTFNLKPKDLLDFDY